MKIALITGASAGIGRETAKLFSANGIKVYAAARRMEKLEELKSENITPIYLDITEDDSVQSCVAEIIEKEGKIDILVNNAGYGSYGSLEEVPISEAKRQFEVNVFGLARITQIVLPTMRKARSGKIVNISSMAGKISMPLGSWYHGTKHALEAMSDALRMEVGDFGIDVIIIEPGTINSEWDSIAYESMKKYSSDGPYKKTAETMMKLFRSNYSEKAPGPELIADLILKAVNAKKPRTRYVAPFNAKASILLRKLLSEDSFDRIFRRILGLTK